MKGERGEPLLLFARFLERNLGLHFPQERLGELESKMAPLARREGFADTEKYLLWLMSAPLAVGQQESLVAALTIGETYFLRDPKSYRLFEERLLPELMAEREKAGKFLRIWSAGCSSGEEPYSIAILLSRAIPELAAWNITLLATDLNPQALERARRGVYGPWSFRNAPAWLMEYFSGQEGRRFELAPRIREMVSFRQLNLADLQAVTAVGEGGKFDIIFCRNVMLYFDAKRIARTVACFREVLAEGGWLLVGPAEVGHGTIDGFVCRHFGDAIALQKDSSRKADRRELTGAPAPHAAKGGGAAAALHAGGAKPAISGGSTPVGAPAGAMEKVARTLQPPEPFPVNGATAAAQAAAKASPPPAHAGDSLAARTEAGELYRAGRYREAAERAAGGGADADAGALLLAARAWANLGELPRARECCEQAIARERLSPDSHYLLAVILEQQGDLEGAIRAVRNALFIDHDYLLAYFALGNLHRQAGDEEESARNFATALKLLERRPAEEIVEQAEGLTAGRLAQLIRRMASGATR